MFISQLKPDDPYHSDALAIGRKLRKGELRAETSVLTILEAASVAGRMYHHAMGDRVNIDERKSFVIKTLKTLAGLVKFVHMPGDVPLSVGIVKAHMPSILNESFLLSFQTTLRTLDLMHVAVAKYAEQDNGELDAFVTGDEGILKLKDQLSVMVGMPFMSPREYARGLGLK